MKVSESAIDELKLGSSTQKWAAVNRSLSVALPKNTNYSRNVEGRLHSTIHRVNLGTATSAARKLESVGVKISDQSLAVLESIEEKETYQKWYQKSARAVKRRLMGKGRHIQEHLQYKATHCTRSDYRRGQLDPIPSTSRAGTENIEHSYSR